MLLVAIISLFATVSVLLCGPTLGAEICTLPQTSTCLDRGDLDFSAVVCLASNPSTCSPSICVASKWKAALACTEELGCSVGSYLEPDQCAATFVVCNEEFLSDFCGASATKPPALTIPSNITGVNDSDVAADQPRRPAKLKFGMAADQAIRITGCQELGGIQMAFKQINKNGGAAGTKLELVFENIPNNEPSKVVDALHRQLVHENVFAFSQPSYIASTIYDRLAAPNAIPMINPFIGDLDFRPDRNVVSIRAHTTQSIYHFIKYAIHGKPMCSRFGIAMMTIKELTDFADILDGLMDDSVFGKMVRSELPYTPVTDFNEQVRLFDPLFADDDYIPNCILLMNHLEIISALRRHPKFDPTTHIFQTDYTPLYTRWVDTFEGHSEWHMEHVSVFSFFPDPHHPTSRLAWSYREALKEHVYSKEQPVCTHEPSTLQFEAYAAGRFIGEVVSKMDPNNFTRSNFIDTVYKTGLFQIDDMRIGIFSDGCDGLRTEAIGSCSCTFGGRQVFTRAIGADGYPTAYNDNHTRGEFGVAELTIPSHTCTITSALLSVPVALRFTCLSDSSAFATLSPFYQQLLVGYNRQSQLLERMSRLYYIPTHDYTAPDAAQNITSRYLPAAFVDGDRQLPHNLLHLQVQPGANGGLPRTISGYTFNPYRVWLISFLEDHVHALVSFAATSLKLEDSLHVIGTSVEARAMGVRSVETFGHAPLSSKTAATIEFSTQPGVASAILVVAETATAVVSAMEMAAQHPHMVILLACSEEHLEAAIKLATNPAALSKVTKLYFATPFGEFWNTNTSTFASTLVSLEDTARQYVQVPSQLSVAKMRASLALNVFAASAELRQSTMSQLYEWLHIPGVRDIGGISYGPLSRESCASSDRLCECTKGLRKLFVFPVADRVTNTHTGNGTNFHFTSSTCSPDYKPLPKFTLSAEIIVTIIVAVFAVLFGVIAVIAATRKLRNTATAPKDESKPFAMVFTDIQSSTTLWAECPMEMGEGVETHHTILRSLIKEHHGYEVKTIGDSFMVAFTSPLKATKFALDIQTTLFHHTWGTNAFDEVYREKISDAATAEEKEGVGASELKAQIDPELWNGIRVRVGVHYGTGSIQKDEVTQGYDYYGTVVNTAARVESVGNGGQVLLTEAAYEAVFVDRDTSHSLGHVEIEDMGPQPLRGLPQDVRLYQCTPATLSARRYAPLRIETESPKDGEEADAPVELMSQSYASDSSRSESYSEDEGFIRDTLISRAVQRHWNTTEGQNQAKDRLSEGLRFINGILVTAGGSYRKSFIKHVSSKWHIDMKANHENTALIDVLVRVLLGIETKERRRQGGGGGGMGMEILSRGAGSSVSLFSTKMVSVGPADYPL